MRSSAPAPWSAPIRRRTSTASAGRALDEALDRHGIAHDIKIYAGAGHSFFNDRSRAHHKASAADSWTRVLQFFGEHLASNQQQAHPAAN